MKLISAQVKDFKCIEDSGEFSLSDVTCLVGKNESGKTALLQALYKLNPDVRENGKFSDLEYPRSKWRPNMSPKDLPKDVVVSTWELDDADAETVSKGLGLDVLKSRTITITKGYDNSSVWGIDYDEAKLAEHLVKSAHLAAPESNIVRNQKSVDGIIAALKAADRSENQNAFLAALERTFKRGSTGTAIIDLLQPRLPKFLYFSSYNILPGQVSLTQFLEREANNQLTIGDRVFDALLDLAGTSPKAISDINTFERLRASLEAVSNRLSDEIFNYWTQNAHLEVTFGFDHARPQDPAPFNSGYVFRTAIKNRRHKSTVNFDDRSTGFVWFFSFLVWFSQLRETYGDRLIILLDEPALNLHARAQADLLRYVNERLKPEHQVLYSTHSPFMVDPDNLAGTRTVEDVVQREVDTTGREREVLLGTKVSQDVLSVDPDTISPLQAAIGYDITQTLFVGKYNLLVEGPSDLLYLNWFSQQLRAAGRSGLDQRWTICPVGGLDKVSSFASLFAGNRLKLAVFTDYHKGQKNKIRTLMESKILLGSKVFTANMFSGTEEADIEDVIGRENYKTLVNAAYALKGENALDGAVVPDPLNRVMEEVEAHMRTVKGDVPEFDHFAPALFLLENSSGMVKQLPKLDEALGRFEQLFIAVNDLLPAGLTPVGKPSKATAKGSLA